MHHETIQKGAYGMSNRASNIRSYHYRPEGGFQRTFTTRYMMTIENRDNQEIEVMVRKTLSFYFEHEGQLHEVDNRRSLLRAFPDHSSSLRQYLRQNETDFSNEGHMLKLREYILGLLKD